METDLCYKYKIQHTTYVIHNMDSVKGALQMHFHFKLNYLFAFRSFWICA